MLNEWIIWRFGITNWFRLFSYFHKIPEEAPGLEVKATHGLASPQEFTLSAAHAMWAGDAYAGFDASKARPQDSVSRLTYARKWRSCGLFYLFRMWECHPVVIDTIKSAFLRTQTCEFFRSWERDSVFRILWSNSYMCPAFFECAAKGSGPWPVTGPATECCWDLNGFTTKRREKTSLKSFIFVFGVSSFKVKLTWLLKKQYNFVQVDMSWE